MKISIIIPTYNEEKTVKDCLDSLLNQNLKDMEIIVVDDGSTDKTLKEIQKTEIIQIFKQKHKGAGAARNMGAKKAKGDILIFIDADMTFDKSFINKLIEPIIKGESIGTFSKEEYLANKDNLWARSWNINRGLPGNKMHPTNYSDTQKVFRAIKKDSFLKAGGFDEKAGYTDDWSLSERLGIEAINAPGAIFYHKNPDSLKEVFIQSRWMAKRKYKLGVLGALLSLLRVSFPVSIGLGIIKGVRSKLPGFLLFKLVSDFGVFLGILEFVLFKRVAK